MDDFIPQLASILDEEQILPFLQHFTATMRRHPVACRHDHLRPAAVDTCFSAGTTDLGKAMAVRKSTVYRAAFEFAKLGPTVLTEDHKKLAGVSTKVRVHHLFKLAACANTDDLRAVLESNETSLLHLCGHGICTVTRRLACVNPQHTVWGTQDTNVRHTHAHSVLELATTPAEYNTVLTMIGRNPAFHGVF